MIELGTKIEVKKIQPDSRREGALRGVKLSSMHTRTGIGSIPPGGGGLYIR